ncbi:hypothetical protein HMPREF9457_00634, partial [Dorea formicigenerans 4_6_53AFAA]
NAVIKGSRLLWLIGFIHHQSFAAVVEISKKDLKLSDRVYRCACGNIIDRDFQASINLKAYGERFAS